ncbi:PepSY-like domain-containing protein [Lacinutrix undariae]
MKKAATILALFAIIFTSCSNDDDNNSNDSEIVLTEAQIPSEITAYIAQHFPSNTTNTVIEDTDDNVITYEVYLSESVQLEFNSNFEIIEIDSLYQLPNSVIPQAILDYVVLNYPTNFINGWELEYNHQQIDLNNNIELEFEMNGDFIRIDND